MYQSKGVWRLDNIIIAGITMPRTRSLEVGGSYESKEATMASGKIVRDIVGFRIELTANWEYLPAETLTQLVSAARGGSFVQIKYPDPVSGETDGMFSVSIGTQKIFKFVNGNPYWYNVSLTATAQEVQ
jgi:hypothetical protein|uniref:Uncharacterized protein n=1 Tax=Myoviridae sp. ctr0w28 TaxID=2826703 RepID=A0A8S5NRG2_9CAUD|nr:MAG TPA: hypothetical protein [Myoviridae sp. ctr0w28]